MHEKQRTLRLLAAGLRQKLERSVPSDILEKIADSELIQKWHDFEALRCAAIRSKVNATGC